MSKKNEWVNVPSWKQYFKAAVTIWFSLLPAKEMEAYKNE